MNKHHYPPAWVDRLLESFCSPHLLEEVQGDLHELFEKWVQKYGVRRAKWLYVLHALKFFRPYSIKRLSFNNPYAMLKNYFIIAIRNLRKQKLYSFINIGGLAVGLASFLLIMVFVQHELSYDNFYKNADRIHRIVQRQTGNDYLGTDYFAVTPAPLAAVLLDEFSEITNATIVNDQMSLLQLDDQSYWEKGIWADAHFFEVFDFPLLQGNIEIVLAQPYSIVLTSSLAHKIFGEENPLGKTLLFQNEDTYTVTGIMPDLPDNSSLQYEFITTIQSESHFAEQLKQQRWGSNSYYVFFTLAEGINPQQLQTKLALSGIPQKFQTDNSYPFHDEYYVHALSDLHLQSGINFDIGLKGDKKYIYLFSIIAVLILLLACINYMNLAVARSIKRAREVGLRKVIGAARLQLMFQFLGESILIAFLALLLALALVQVLEPFFSQLVERSITLDFLGNSILLPGLIVLMIAVGIFSGSYPAIFMSRLEPVKVLKGKVDGRTSNVRVQRLLIIGQYAVSIALVMSSLVIYYQLQYMQQKELGYEKEHVVTVGVRDHSLLQNYDVIRNEWLSNSNILAMTASNSLPTNVGSSTIINDEDGSGKEDDLAIYEWRVNYDFLKVFGIELVAGRTFSPEIASDVEEGYIINETAAHALGWTPEEAIGKQFTHNGTETVIGVVKDFHMHSMHIAIQPLMIHYGTSWLSNISLKVSPDDLPETITMLEKTVKRFSPYPFDYKFLDEHFDQLYKADVRLGETFGFFTILALLIASLGLFGLAAFTAEQRTKEIGIRKVLGASVRNIVTLLSTDFLRLVALSFLLATPIAWFAMHQWLQDFAYRIDIQWWMFALAGIMAIVIAGFTISYQSIRAAIADPVDSLRNE